MLRVVEKSPEMEAEILPTLDEIAREGARWMLLTALEGEVASYVERHQERDEKGHALVVRNGKAQARTVTMGSGTVEIRAPRVNDRRRGPDGERRRFTSKILPPYMRRSPKVSEVLPVLYLRGLSTGDFQEALPTLLGEKASGLSATNITRMTAAWQEEYERFQKCDLTDRDYVYVWVDGIHVNVRLEEDRLCLLVMIGVRPDGTKELVAIEDGYRESQESWSEMLRDLSRRGMQAPVLAVGDGALGFWAALREVWPATRVQRDWFHRLGNVLDKLPKRLQGKAKKALHEVMYADTREDAQEALQLFVESYEAKHPKAVASLLHGGEESLLSFFDFPAEHWKHLRTSNVVESPFATVRLRQRVTKGPGSRTKGLTMAFKLLDMAQKRWRRLNGSELLPLVREGAKFVNGARVERVHQPQEERIAA
jgi:transposase-like protein